MRVTNAKAKEKAMTTYDSEYIICPHCGAKHGDAWEWCFSEEAVEVDCQDCGRVFLAWAEHSVEYASKPKPSSKVAKALGIGPGPALPRAKPCRPER